MKYLHSLEILIIINIYSLLSITNVYLKYICCEALVTSPQCLYNTQLLLAISLKSATTVDSL